MGPIFIHVHTILIWKYQKMIKSRVDGDINAWESGGNEFRGLAIGIFAREAI